MLTWPNRITLARICLIPLFVMLVLQVGGDPNSLGRYLASILFLFMAITDAIDGILARVRGEKTKLGRVMDPLADKFLLTTACVLLALDIWPQPRLPNWVPVFVISRDVLIVVGAAVLYLMTGSLGATGPTLIGKMTTCLQMTMVLLTLLNNLFPEWLVRLSWWLAVAFTCVSGLQYLYIGSRHVNYAESQK